MKKSNIVRKSVLVFTVICAVPILISAGDAALDLSQYKWKNRLLFVFAPHSNHPSLIDLKNDLSVQKEAILDRDLIVFQIYETGPSFEDMNEIDHDTADKLRRKFRVSPCLLTVILVGKDGAVRLRQNQQANLKLIFLLIDGMPMRREEMRRKDQ